MLRSTDTLYNILDQNTGETVSYNKVSAFIDGTPMSDSKCDGVIYRKLGAEYFKRNFTEINVEWFRTSSDDWETLQNAFNFVQKTKYSYTQYTLRLPEDRQYGISQPLLLNTSSDVTLIGGGLRKSSIYATTSMSALIILGGTGFTGRCHIQGITLYDNNLADVCIDARGTRYSTFEDNEIVVHKSGGIGMRVNNWVQRVENNLFQGVADNPSTGLVLDNSSSTNNFNITDNSFSDFQIGLKVDDISNSLNILNNNFDNCYGTGIYIAKGARGITIENNYFEATGNVGIDITKGATGSTVERWKGAIIAHHDYRSSDTWINGLIIKKNQFSNCGDINSGVITISGINYCEISNNFSYLSYSNKYFVDIKWQGIGYTQSNLLLIDHTPSTSTQFSQLVGLNADTPNSNLSNIVIRQRDNLPWFYQLPMPVFDNPYLWDTSAMDAFHEEIRFNSYNGYKTLNYRGTVNNATQTLTINVATTCPALLDKYYRVNWYSKGISTNVGFSLTYKIDGVVSGSWSSSSNGVWANGGKNATIYIPKTATVISFEFATPTQLDARLLSCFSITPCSYDLNDMAGNRYAPTEVSNDIYYNGGNPNGNQYARIGRLCLSINDGKLYRKTTNYASNTGWVEIKDSSVLAPIASPLFTGSVGINTGGLAPLSNLDIIFANGSIPTDLKTRGVLTEYYGVGAYGGKGGLSLIANGTKTSPTSVAVNDIATISTAPLFYDGTAFRVGCFIDSIVTTVVPNTSVSSSLRFWTGTVTGDSAAGSSTGITERMRLTDIGNLLLGTTTDVSTSLFTMSSITKGFLPPRVTTTQRDGITSPADGLVLVNTDQGRLNIYSTTLTAWRAIMSDGLTTKTYAATTNIDFNAARMQTVSLTGDITFTTSNIRSGSDILVRVVADASLRNLVFPAGWTFMTSAAPASIAASKTGLLTLRSFGTTDANIIAKWEVQP